MDAKSFLKNKSICALPWTGFELEPSGEVKNCIISKHKLGNINHTNIKNIMQGDKNINLNKIIVEYSSNFKGSKISNIKEYK